MSINMVIVLMFVMIAVGVFLGFPIAFVLAGLGLIFGYIFWGPQVVNLMAARGFAVMTNMTYVAIPLFVFMGCMLEHSGIANVAFGALNQWLRRIRGGLGVATIAICTMFGACVGVVGASVTTMGLLALPPMVDRGYSKSLATGIVAAGGSLGILIPPSIMIVVFGPVAGVSVVKLFAGAVPPGFLLAIAYIVYILVCGFVKKDMVPPAIKKDDPNVKLEFTLAQGLASFLPFIVLILLVMGSILLGIAAPTEAAGVGALGAILIAIGYRRFNKKSVVGSAIATLSTSAMVMFVILGANVFTAVFFGLGGTKVVTNFINAMGLGPNGLFAVVLIVVFILGVFIDWVGITLIVVPVFMPILVEFGFDPLFVSLIIIVLMQTSFLTPPFAYAIFYIAGIAPPGVTVMHIYKGVLPFIAIQVVVVALCIWQPNILLWLPNALNTGM